MAHISSLVCFRSSRRIRPNHNNEEHAAAEDGSNQDVPASPPISYPSYCQPRDMVTINVGGTKYETSIETLKSVPNTRLSALATDYGSFTEGGYGEHREFVFDHTPFLFQYILDYYRTGELHLPQRVCGRAIKAELEFWGLNEFCISTCCWQPYMASLDDIKTYERLHQEFNDHEAHKFFKATTKTESKRQKVWTFLEDINSSKGSKAYGIISSLLIMVNICTYMLGTLASLREEAPYHNSLSTAFNATHNTTDDLTNDVITYISEESLRNAKLRLLLTTQPHPVLFYFDIFCFVFFTLEYLVMLVVCPHRFQYTTSFLAICDIVYLFPLGLMLGLYYLDHGYMNSPSTVIGLIVLQGLLAFRVLRIIRVVRHYRGFVVLALSLRASARELLLLMLLMILALIFFANAIFFAELLQFDTFSTVFHGVWWSLITITTIGYGDMYPKSTTGYVVGSICALAGLILVSLPIPVIANNFNTYYAFRRKKRVSEKNVLWQGSKDDYYMPVTFI